MRHSLKLTRIKLTGYSWESDSLLCEGMVNSNITCSVLEKYNLKIGFRSINANKKFFSSNKCVFLKKELGEGEGRGGGDCEKWQPVL